MLIKSSLERKILGGLGLASIIIAGVTLSYHLGTEHLVASNGQVWRSYSLLRSLNGVEHGLKKLHTGTRAYVQSADTDNLITIQTGREETEKALVSLRAEASDLHLGGFTRDIEKLARQQIRESADLVRLRDSGGARVAAIYGEARIGSDSASDALRKSTDRLQRVTQAQLNESERLAHASHTVMFVILLLGAAIELAFAVAAAGVVRRDVTERKRVAESIEQSERTLRSFFESGITMMGMVELLDAENDILHISDNSATGEYFGRNPADMAGKRSTELGAPRACIDMWLEKYRESISRGGPVTFEYQSEMGGQTRWISAVVCPIERTSGSSAAAGRPRFSYIMLDITARKQAEDALRKHADALTFAKDALEEARRTADAANEAKSNFLANMSHEIRTPMTAVVGYADLLAEPGRTDQERGEWVSVIRRNARHLLELINDILDLSKIEAGKMALESVPCDPNQIIADVLAMMRPRALEKHIRLSLERDSELPPQINADPLRLRQVLANLVGNAIKFTEAGEVTVRVEWEEGRADNRLHIAVRDTGIGMSGAQLERLFRPFTQADETMTRRFGGTGLGLTISQRLVQMMGGTLAVQSEEGVGSTFVVALPIAVTNGGGGTRGGDVPLLPSPGSSPAASPAALNSNNAAAASLGRVLLAEDAPDMQRLMAFIVSRAGAEVTCVGNGLAALEAIDKQPFGVILLDMQMPEMDGYTTATEIRKRGIITPIIAVTAHAMAGDRERCLAAGCTDYMTKPIDSAELLRRVRDYLAQSGTRRAA